MFGKFEFNIQMHEVHRIMGYGANIEDNLKLMYLDDAWRMPRQVKVDQILQAIVLGSMRANQNSSLPVNMGKMVEKVYADIDCEFSEGQNAIRISTLELHSKMLKWMRDTVTYKRWTKSMIPEVAVYNIALRIEEETSWVIIPNETSTSGRFRPVEIFERWRTPRLMHQDLIAQGFAMGVMKSAARAGRGYKLPPQFDSTIRLIVSRLRENYEMVGSKDEIVETELNDLLNSLREWIYKDKAFKKWLSSMEPDEILMGTIRWLDNELCRIEEAALEAWEDSSEDVA